MQKRIGVIFVSRRNSLRSILAEVCLTHLDPKRFSVSSCGQPGQVAREFHPAAIAALKSASIPLPNRQPRGWDELARANAHAADFVITLDDPPSRASPHGPASPMRRCGPTPTRSTAATPTGSRTTRCRCCSRCAAGSNCW